MGVPMYHATIGIPGARVRIETPNLDDYLNGLRMTGFNHCKPGGGDFETRNSPFYLMSGRMRLNSSIPALSSRHHESIMILRSKILLIRRRWRQFLTGSSCPQARPWQRLPPD